MPTRKQNRFRFLRDNQFLPLEARELSKLEKRNPVLRMMIQDRLERRARFEKIAVRKIETGQWKRSDIPKKWIKNISRMYSRMGLRVKEGPRGKQQRLAKRTPNPWALYRAAQRRAGVDKDFIRGYPDVAARRPRGGLVALQKGLVFVQKIEKRTRGGAPVSPEVLRSWVAQLDKTIAAARGVARGRLVRQRQRLVDLLPK